MAKIITISISVFSYLALYALSVRALIHPLPPQRFLAICVWLIVAYLGMACMHFQPWFVIWPIALGTWVSHPLARRVLLVFTASALLSYAANFVWIWNYKAWQILQVNTLFVAVIFVPPLVVGLAHRSRRVWGRWGLEKGALGK